MTTRDETIVGGRQLDDLLQTLPVKTEKNIMRTALRAGAKVLLDEVKQRIPADKGALRASARLTTRASKGQVTASVKVGNSVAWYARLVEFGTRPHLIKVSDEDRGMNRRTGRLMSMTTVNRRVLQIGGAFVGPVVSHPGAQPKPFMRPAADAALPAAVAAIQAKVRERLSKNGLNVPPPTPPDSD